MMMMMIMMKEENKNGPIYYIYEYYIYILYICMYAHAYVRTKKKKNVVCTFYDKEGRGARGEMYYYRYYTRELRESEKTMKKERGKEHPRCRRM